MVASRRGPKGGLVTPFGLGFLTFVVVPSAIGSQDLAALVARQPAIAERPASRFSLISTAHGATFTMPRPMSAAMPASLSYTLAGLDTSYADITGSIRERLLGETMLVRRDDARTCRCWTAGSKATAFRLRRPREQAETARVKRTVGRAGAGRSSPLRGSAAQFQLASVDRHAPPPAPSVASVGAPEIAAPETVAPQNLSRRRTSAALPREFAPSLAVGIGFTPRRGRPGLADGAALFRRRADGRDARSPSSLGQQGEEPKVETLTVSVDTDVTTASLTPDPTPAERPSSTVRRRRRDHRQQGRGHRRRPPSDVAGRAARA